MYRILKLLIVLCVFTQAKAQANNATNIIILGIAQDGGYPHTGCTKKCCSETYMYDTLKKNVVSIALIDSVNKKWWLFEATPDIEEQLHYFNKITNGYYNYLPNGIFITHAHIGHYTGLMVLSREVMNTKNVTVYCMPKLKSFLETNGPWSQLVSLQNIVLQTLNEGLDIKLEENIYVKPFVVPHRDEYSETAGFIINANNIRYLFIPDINKWQVWNKDIIKEVEQTDIAFLDGTFFDENELPGRTMESVPHPFIKETMNIFDKVDKNIKSKIHFIHFNHTNPLLWDYDKQTQVIKEGYNITKQGEKL